MSAPFVTVVAPPGSLPGQQVPVVTTTGQQYLVTIPNGVAPGQAFQAPLPTEPMVSGTPVGKNGHVDLEVGPQYTVDVEQSSRRGANRAMSGALVCFGIAVAIASLTLLTSISYYFNTFAVPCTKCSWGTCWITTCYYTNYWVTTQPISVDALPYRNASGDSTEANGDGSPDNYALIVACVCGTIGGLMTACITGPGLLRRDVGGRNVINVGLLLSFLLLVASIVCLSVQMIANKDQWVYNAFCGYVNSRCTEPYQYISGSLASYWSNDHYYRYYGQLVYLVYSLTIMLGFFEMCAFIV